MFDNSIPLGAYALVGVIAMVLSYTLVSEGSGSASGSTATPSGPSYTSSLPSISSILPTALTSTPQAQPVSQSSAPVAEANPEPAAGPPMMGGKKARKRKRYVTIKNRTSQKRISRPNLYPGPIVVSSSRIPWKKLYT